MFTTPERSQIMPPTAAIRMGDTIMSTEGIIRMMSFIAYRLFLRGTIARAPVGEQLEGRPQ